MTTKQEATILEEIYPCPVVYPFTYYDILNDAVILFNPFRVMR
ncbi:hypothetical protein V6R21_21845 [Limibacter armeniacum]